MKYSISSRQEKAYIEKVDEIRVEYRDRNIIYDFIEQYPDKTIMLKVPREDVDWEEIEVFAKKGDILCSLENIYDCTKCREIGAKYMYTYPVQTYFELQGLKDLGVHQAYIGMPLFFDLPKVKEIGVSLRAVPNVAFEPYIPRLNGFCGQWIRPDDVGLYEEFIDIFEFHTEHLSQERALYRIYAEQHKWPGELHEIITNLGETGIRNGAIYPEIAQVRLTCKQKCQSGHPCTLCERSLHFGEILQRYRDIKEKRKSELAEEEETEQEEL